MKVHGTHSHLLLTNRKGIGEFLDAEFYNYTHNSLLRIAFMRKLIELTVVFLLGWTLALYVLDNRESRGTNLNAGTQPVEDSLLTPDSHSHLPRSTGQNNT